MRPTARSDYRRTTSGVVLALSSAASTNQTGGQETNVSETLENHEELLQKKGKSKPPRLNGRSEKPIYEKGSACEVQKLPWCYSRKYLPENFTSVYLLWAGPALADHRSDTANTGPHIDSYRRTL